MRTEVHFRSAQRHPLKRLLPFKYSPFFSSFLLNVPMPADSRRWIEVLFCVWPGSELMVICKGWFETVPCRATLNTPFPALCPRILGTRFTNYTVCESPVDIGRENCRKLAGETGSDSLTRLNMFQGRFGAFSYRVPFWTYPKHRLGLLLTFYLAR